VRGVSFYMYIAPQDFLIVFTAMQSLGIPMQTKRPLGTNLRALLFLLSLLMVVVLRIILKYTIAIYTNRNA